MITFDFDYYRPDNQKEAVDTYQNLKNEGKRVLYYAGGTEIISLARTKQIQFDAVIDIKSIPECNVLEFQNETLVIGAAVTLTKIVETNLFPLLSVTSRRAADHTSRDKITLGGNICGRLPYKEGLLPLLLADAQVVIASRNGTRNIPIAEAFNKEWYFNDGEFVLQINVEKSFITLPFYSIKKTKQGKVDYPLITIASLKKEGKVRVAFSGFGAYPFRELKLEEELNHLELPLEKRINNAFCHLPCPIHSDIRGSAKYREFVARNALEEALVNLGGCVTC